MTNILTATAEFQMFSPLKCVPSVLNLLPSSIFQLSTRDGPPGRPLLHFTTTDDSIAPVGARSGIITTNLTGVAIVSADARATADYPAMQCSSRIIVAEPQTVSVRLSTPAVLVGERVHAVAVTDVSNDSFGFHDNWRVKFTWELSGTEMEDCNETVVADWERQYTTMTQGSVTFVVTMQYVNLEGVTLTLRSEPAQLSIHPQFSLLSPAHLLMPPTASVALLTNLPTSRLHAFIHCGDASLLSFFSASRLVAGAGVVGELVVILEDLVTAQRVRIVVTIEEVVGLRVVGARGQRITAAQGRWALGIGSVRDIKVGMFDRTNRMFNAVGGLGAEALSNRHSRAAVAGVHHADLLDPVLLADETDYSGVLHVRVQGMAEGTAMVRVSVAGAHLYIELEVQNLLSPTEASIHLGAKVQFEAKQPNQLWAGVPVGGRVGDERSWWSSDDAVASVDPATGLVTAGNVEGRAVIYHRFSDGSVASTALRVGRVESILAGETGGTIAIVTHGTEAQAIPLKAVMPQFSTDQRILNQFEVTCSQTDGAELVTSRTEDGLCALQVPASLSAAVVDELRARLHLCVGDKAQSYRQCDTVSVVVIAAPIPDLREVHLSLESPSAVLVVRGAGSGVMLRAPVAPPFSVAAEPCEHSDGRCSWTTFRISVDTSVAATMSVDVTLENKACARYNVCDQAFAQVKISYTSASALAMAEGGGWGWTMTIVVVLVLVVICRFASAKQQPVHRLRPIATRPQPNQFQHLTHSRFVSSNLHQQ
eukprot:c14963_g1_i3.p1 GENE.c14963_g1_i3~~c14963_g1_i3.p1  ORF type:complete len:785 (+),score=172.45 c14963_g1_i3:63-2357(+)